jgi:ubiquinone/menaquinone biosynthesis C-methylase UbiE
MAEKPNRIGNGFDLLAPIYDFVVFLVFGKTFSHLQHEVLENLPSENRCLIIGGGSGEILSIAESKNLSQQYYYADLSTKMLNKAKLRMASNTKTFIEYDTDWKKWQSVEFDYIILPFVLDCYAAELVDTMIADLKSCLSSKGKVILFDFNQEEDFGYEPNKLKDQFIRLLYWFFSKTAGLKVKTLPHFNMLFEKQGFQTEIRSQRLKGWVQGVVFKLSQ